MAAHPAGIQVPPTLDAVILDLQPARPQPEQTGRLRRNATVTITACSPNSTSLTHAPGSPSIRLNAVVTRTSPSFADRLNSTASSLPKSGRRRVARHARNLRDLLQSPGARVKSDDVV